MGYITWSKPENMVEKRFCSNFVERAQSLNKMEGIFKKQTKKDFHLNPPLLHQ